jgi:hypothetical protein
MVCPNAVSELGQSPSMTRTLVLLIGCAALVSGALPTQADGLGPHVRQRAQGTSHEVTISPSGFWNSQRKTSAGARNFPETTRSRSESAPNTSDPPCPVRFSLKAFQSVQSAEYFVPVYTTEPNAANLNQNLAGWQQTQI